MPGEQTGTSGADYALTGLAVPQQLHRLHELLARAAAEHPDVPTEALMMLETAVMEIANNVVIHGRPQGEVAWRFELEVGDHGLTARLTDSGEEYVETWTGEMPDVMEESGRGMPLAEATLHELRYERLADHNVWHMGRRFTSPPDLPETTTQP